MRTDILRKNLPAPTSLPSLTNGETEAKYMEPLGCQGPQSSAHLPTQDGYLRWLRLGPAQAGL